jgi:hypothetical protein
MALGAWFISHMWCPVPAAEAEGPLPNVVVHLLPLSAPEDVKKKAKYREKFDAMVFANRCALLRMRKQGIMCKGQPGKASPHRTFPPFAFQSFV